MNDEKNKTVNSLYIILVWSGKRNDHIEWGIHYKNKELAINHFVNYMNGIATMDSEHWNDEHINYASKPFKVKETIITSYIEESICDEQKLDLPETKALRDKLKVGQNKNREER